MRERPAPCLRDQDQHNLDRAPASAHALRVRGRQSIADQSSQQFDLKAVRQHDRLGAAARAAGKQFERSSLVRVSRRHARGAPANFGLPSAPMIPQLVQTIRGPNAGTG